MRHLGDVARLRGDQIEPVDIITFGSPCQNLSVAGDRKGLKGDQSSLFTEAVRIIKEMRDHTGGVCPRYAIWENVPGALSSAKGEDFKEVLSHLVKVKDPGLSIPRPKKWDKCGSIVGDDFSIVWRIMDAQFWEVPQRRERIFLVADFGGERSREVLFKCESLSRYFGQSRKKGQATAGDAARNPNQAIPINYNAIRGPAGRSDGFGVGAPGDPAPTIQCGRDHAVFTAGFRGGAGAGKKRTIAYIPDATPPVLSKGPGIDLHVCGTIPATGPGVSRLGGNENQKDLLIYDCDYVRRLTPLECERLFGFSDDWTKYGSGGGAIADTPRYKALGNSIAVPCLEYIFCNLVDFWREEEKG
jgi:DNA (cytosine-5)-methyltransferase 1